MPSVRRLPHPGVPGIGPRSKATLPKCYTFSTKCWHGIWPDGLCGVWPKATGMRPVACGPLGPPPAPMPRSRSCPGSDARRRSPDVILGEAEYAFSLPIYLCLSLSLFAL
jgi:hypothetical protein